MKWTVEDVARLRSLWTTGKSFRVIGAELGRSIESVYRKGKDLGLGSKPFQGETSPTWLLLIRVCQDRRGRTVHEMVKVSGASRHTIDALMRTKEAAGAAHVVDWKKRSGSPIPLWLPFPGKSKPKPRAMTNTERCRARRARLREEDPLAYKALIDRNTVNRARRNGSVRKQHSVVRALFGMGAPA
ncbi:hypothetical protein [Cupriavidus taiwanensis]|uniref:Uncharacterized protein n=1 Tax=Cupriavidus taiwanensis TaxID=164546 RepID=A0A375J122_9BURK|nr:hypothetical protein [Cupriavidus taiwanensis]SPR97366.1 conserved hypothetical protein [Cupriavidus taiwanensis]